jgi:hypothetical protein
VTYPLRFGIVLWLLCGAFLSAQTNPSSAEQKQQPPAQDSSKELKQPDTANTDPGYGLGVGKKPTDRMGPLEILSDTMGVNFGPYVERVLQDVKRRWYELIPESAKAPTMKKGKVTIEFAILKDGTVAKMKFVSTSGDEALDLGAWDGISLSSPFLPLPSEFTGEYLGLRFKFFYNPDKADLGGTTTAPSKSGVTVRISPPKDVNVPIDGSAVVVATAAGSANTAVKWSITGAACSVSDCGTMQGDLYLAPSSLPSPPSVTLTAISEADPTATASITVNLVAAADAK